MISNNDIDSKNNNDNNNLDKELRGEDTNLSCPVAPRIYVYDRDLVAIN